MTATGHAEPGCAPHSRTFRWSGYLLGFSLGGFFDGILLHQILQWHHLLSAVEAEAVADLRVQILADGLLHAAMYVIALAGLFVLWRRRREFALPRSDRILLAAALVGFGAWHVVDAVLSHWLLGIHRVRKDVDNPLFWDLLWFAVFGLAPLVAGWLVDRGRGSGGTVRRRAVAPALLVIAAAVAAVVAAVPPPGATAVTVLFRQGITAHEVFAAVAAVDGRIVWSSASGDLVAIETDRGLVASGQLYRHGALLVSSSLPAGCLAWSAR